MIKTNGPTDICFEVNAFFTLTHLLIRFKRIGI
jgi:hypothetical protein